MTPLSPFPLQPVFSERIWGTRDLRPFYDRVVDPARPPVGEAWLTGEDCVVADGPHAGRTLGELARTFGAALTGNGDPATHFPLLLKVLFPREKLSVQVHPDDAAARRAGFPCGKNECWYVLSAEPGAQVALGFVAGVTEEDVRRAIADGRMEALLRWIDIRPGDMIYVDAGTVHAIGPGSVLLETQQNSDLTYRIYDYGRPRALHLEQAFDAMRLMTRAGRVSPSGSNGRQRLIDTPYFTVERLSANGAPKRLPPPQGPTEARCLYAMHGSGWLAAEQCEPVSFKSGDALVVPACVPECEIVSEDGAQVLVAQRSSKNPVPEPVAGA